MTMIHSFLQPPENTITETLKYVIQTEENTVSRGGIEGDIGEGLSGLSRTFGKCDGVQVSGKGNDGR